MFGHVVVPSSIGMSFLGIKFNQGGIWESDGYFGTSHLMEHLMCKTIDDLRDDLKSVAVNYNAYTSDNAVVFHFSGLEECIGEYAETLFNRITKQETLWTKEGFETEKKTVLQEYGDVFNNQIQGFFNNSLRKHYNYFGPIGKRSDIESFTYEDSLRFAEKYKIPSLICEVGKSFIKHNSFKDDSYPRVPVFGDYDVELEEVPKENKVLVGLLGKNPIDIGLASKIGFIINCINSGLESPLYTEIREKRGLSYFSYGFTNSISNYIIPVFIASTTNEKEKELSNVYSDFFNKKSSDLISKNRFDICMKEIKIHKRIAEVLPHDGAPSTVLGDYNPFENIDDLSYEEALELFDKHLNINNLLPISY